MNDKPQTAFACDKTLRLGARMRDALSGFEGIAYCYSEHIAGMRTYGLQAPVKPDGTMPDCKSFDLHMLDVVDDGVSNRAHPLAATTIRLGDEVEHRLTTTSGVVKELVWFTNGCLYVSAQPKATKDKLDPDSIYADHKLFTVKKAQRVQVEHPKGGAVVAGDPLPAGGPITSVRRPY